MIRFSTIWSTTKIMPEQQKINDTTDAARGLNMEKLSKIEQSSMSLKTNKILLRKWAQRMMMPLVF